MGCRYKHPKICSFYIRDPDRTSRKGCKFNGRCINKHPPLCSSWENQGQCPRDLRGKFCKYFHRDSHRVSPNYGPFTPNIETESNPPHISQTPSSPSPEIINNHESTNISSMPSPHSALHQTASNAQSEDLEQLDLHIHPSPLP